jgi:CheY-like chemotaxis protein
MGHFDAVLMDLQMPVMDGYEATRQLRLDPAFATLPILAMTAHAMLPERERCLDLGMNDYITKPINPDELYGTLAKWLLRGEPTPAPAPVPPRTRPEPGPATAPSGLSREAGLASFSGNEALYEKMLGRFLELKPLAADEIRAALEQEDPETASRLAHSMVAVAGTIGALRLSASSRALQYAIQAGVPEVQSSTLEQFQEDLAVVVTGLKVRFGHA